MRGAGRDGCGSASTPPGRRYFLRLLVRAGAVLVGASAALSRPRRARGLSAELATRAVQGGDAGALQAIMSSSVRDADAFFGKCGEWSLSWASGLTARSPDSVVLTRDGTPIAFLEIAPIRPAPAALDPTASHAARERYRARERSRTTLKVTAAGVRDDVLSADESVDAFRQIIYRAFLRARQLGYTRVEAIAPWEQHPRLPRKWTDYPGCELVEPVSRAQGEGKDLYWLRWDLEQAVTALEAEGVKTESL